VSPQRINLDASLAGADWMRSGTWDLLDVTDVDSLQLWLLEHRLTVDEFKKLPVYLENLDALPWLKAL
jgi:hypothetical protein